MSKLVQACPTSRNLNNSSNPDRKTISRKYYIDYFHNLATQVQGKYLVNNSFLFERVQTCSSLFKLVQIIRPIRTGKMYFKRMFLKVDKFEDLLKVRQSKFNVKIIIGL